jgi:hypothetical protein
MLCPIAIPIIEGHETAFNGFWYYSKTVKRLETDPQLLIGMAAV